MSIILFTKVCVLVVSCCYSQDCMGKLYEAAVTFFEISEAEAKKGKMGCFIFTLMLVLFLLKDCIVQKLGLNGPLIG